MTRKYILLSIGLIFLLRASVWLLPMQRDGVGYAYIGKQITQGAVIYKDVWDHKPPGVYFLNAVIYKFSPQAYVQGLRMASLITAVSAAILLFFFLRQYVSVKTAGITTFFFSIFSNVYFLTVGDNLIEGYMLPFLILLFIAFDLALRQGKNIWLVLTGILLGILFLFKQIGILPFGAIVLFLVLEKRLKALTPLLLIMIGIVAAVAPFAAYVIKNNIVNETFDAIFLYNIVYSRQPLEIRSLAQSLYYAMQVILASLLFWVLAATGALQKKYSRLDILFLLLFFASFIGVAMGGKFAFTRHYFLLLFPSLSYFVAKALDDISAFYKQKRIRLLLIIGTAAVLLPSIIMQVQVLLSGFFYTGTVNFEKREMQYLLGLPQYNYVEEQKITRSVAKYLQARLASAERILNWGAEPELYLYTKTSSSTRYFYNFSLNGTFIKGDPMLAERRKIFMKEIEENKPIFVIVNGIEVKHQPGFDSLDFPEFKNFLHQYYRRETTIGNFIIFRL